MPFSSTTLALSQLPPDLRRIAQTAVCKYRPAIQFGADPTGNAAGGAKGLASRQVQKAKFGAKVARFLEDESVVFPRPMVQVHPHTGEGRLCWSL